MNSGIRSGDFARVLVALLGLLTATSCSTLGRATDPFSTGPEARAGRIEVTVQNLNFSDANFFAFRQGERIRLGSVTGKSDESFNLAWNFSLPLRFEAQLIGGQSCRVRDLMVDPGDELWVRIPTELSVTPCTVGKR